MQVINKFLAQTLNIYEGESVWTLGQDGGYVIGDQESPLTLLLASLNARIAEDRAFCREQHGWAQMRKSEILRDVKRIGDYLGKTERKYAIC